MQLHDIFMPVAPGCFWGRRYACLSSGLAPSPLTCAEHNLAALSWAPTKHVFFLSQKEPGDSASIHRLCITHWQGECIELWGLPRTGEIKNKRLISQVHSITEDSHQITHTTQRAWRLAEFKLQFLFCWSLLNFSWDPIGRYWIWLLMNQDTLYWF